MDTVETGSLPLETLERAEVDAAIVTEEVVENELEKKIDEVERIREHQEMEDEKKLLKAAEAEIRYDGETSYQRDNPSFEHDDDDFNGLKQRKAIGVVVVDDLVADPSMVDKVVDAVHVQKANEEVDEGSYKKAILCSLIICLGSFAFGLVIGYPSPAMPDLNAHRNPFHITDDQNSWVGSIVTLAALAGSLCTGFYMDRLGRKLGLLIITVPLEIGWIIIVSSPNFGCLMAGRAVTGVCMGVLSVLCPVYLSEVSPPSIRGLLGSSHQLFICIGILFTYCFGDFLSWTWLAIASMVMVLLLAALVPIIPESPRWLYQKNQKEAAREALLWIRGENANVDIELREIEEGIMASQEQASIKEFLQPQLYKPLLISLFLMVFQQFSGINVIMFYTVSIFQQAKVDLDSNVQSIIVGVVGVVGTLVSVAISDKAGRRILLMASATVMTLSMAGMGAYFWEQMYGNTSSITWLPIVCLVFFNFGFDMAFGPIPWLMMSELFPQRAKGLATSVSSAANWLFAFIMTKTWVNMTSSLGIYGAYWLCCAFCAISIPFVIIFVPETKGKTLEEIEESFK